MRTLQWTLTATLRTIAVVLIAPLVSAYNCGGYSPTAPAVGSHVHIYAFNSSQRPLTTEYSASAPIEVGASAFVISHYSLPSAPIGSTFSFTVIRNQTSIARVSYRLLRFPDTGQTQRATIVISEASTGVLSASTSDTLWIQVVGIEPLR